MIQTVSSVRLAVPENRAEMAREFYRDVLGLEEVSFPEGVGAGSGLQFRIADGRLLRLEEVPGFIPAHSSYPVFAVEDLSAVAKRFEEFLFDVEWDPSNEAAFYVYDPFGNKLAFCPQDTGDASRRSPE